MAIDPRPWRMLEVPLGEFAAFCDGIRPQLYWDILNTPDNVSAYSYMGFPPPEGAITPEFLVESSAQLLAPFDRWIVPIALGSPHDATAWGRFQRAAWEQQMHAVNVWRYSTTTPAVFEYLGANPAGAEPASIARSAVSISTVGFGRCYEVASRAGARITLLARGAA